MSKTNCLNLNRCTIYNACIMVFIVWFQTPLLRTNLHWPQLTQKDLKEIHSTWKKYILLERNTLFLKEIHSTWKKDTLLERKTFYLKGGNSTLNSTHQEKPHADSLRLWRGLGLLGPHLRPFMYQHTNTYQSGEYFVIYTVLNVIICQNKPCLMYQVQYASYNRHIIMAQVLTTSQQFCVLSQLFI